MPKKQNSVFNTTFSEYFSQGIIGQGGSGFVYKVKDDEGNIYALKCLDPRNLSTKRIRRFKNELFFCSQNDHRNVIKVLDWGYKEAQGVACPFYVMPYFVSNLRELIDEGISHDSVLRLFSEILDGVECAHRKGVSHRDLKPENILYDPVTGNLVLADFGIAHFSEEELHTAVKTHSDERLANFLYSAPEQRVKGQVVDRRADIFSLGLLLNEMFTRKVPQGTGFRKISEAAADYSYLDDLVESLIQADPNARLASIEEIKQKLVARRNEFISYQTLNRLKTQVIPTSEIDDVLVMDPIRLIGIDYDSGGRLVLNLNHGVNEAWVAAFYSIGQYTFIGDMDLSAFNFVAERAFCKPRENEVQQVVNLFKGYLELANHKYKLTLESRAQANERAERESLQREVDMQERRVRILKNTIL